MNLIRAKKRQASYWEYMGNHPEGKDCFRANPYIYPLGLIRWLHFFDQDGYRYFFESKQLEY